MMMDSPALLHCVLAEDPHQALSESEAQRGQENSHSLVMPELQHCKKQRERDLMCGSSAIHLYPVHYKLGHHTSFSSDAPASLPSIALLACTWHCYVSALAARTGANLLSAPELCAYCSRCSNCISLSYLTASQKIKII